MVKGSKENELIEKLAERVDGVAMDENGVVHVPNGLSVTFDARSREYVVSVAIAGKTYLAARISGTDYAADFLAGAV